MDCLTMTPICVLPLTSFSAIYWPIVCAVCVLALPILSHTQA
jgi:hypothetical protein